MFRHAAFFLLLTVSLSYAQDCKDQADFCHSIVDNNKCSLGAAKRLCRKSCGHCSEPAPPRPEPTADCKDERDDCEAGFYICGEYPQLAKQCKQTCEICGQPERPRPTAGAGCEDEASFCHSVVDKNKCGLSAAKRQCRKSCGHCEAPVPPLPTPTDDCKDERDDCENSFYICGEYPELAPQCKMTCEICGGRPGATKNPVETKGCQDRVRRCAELNVSQDCSQDIYKVFCGKKCGLCNDCEDADFCPRSASAAECQDQTVRNDCAKSCGAC